MTKQALRNLYKQKRLDLNEKQLLKMDDLLLIQFQHLALPSIEYLFSYWPISHLQEPNVVLMARYLHFVYPFLKTCYPKIRPNQTVMDAILVDQETDFATNQWGITEPIQGNAIDPLDIQLVFVPLLAFDQKGYRVGYGKGYYDRFLAACDKHLLKIGFSYFEPVVLISDTDQFDVPLNYCITPQRIYEF